MTTNWKLSTWHGSAVEDADGHRVATFATTEQAEFAVRAVRERDELREALEAINRKSGNVDVVRIARAALARVKP